MGFVRDLPHWLVSSFRTTLSAAREADVVLLVVDATDSVATVHENVETSLGELDNRQGTLLPVLNKCDAATDRQEKRRVVTDLAGEAVVTSATEGDGLNALRDRLCEALPERECVALAVPNTDDGNAFVSWCHDHGTVSKPTYGKTIEFELEARPEVTANAHGRAAQLREA